MDTEPLLRITSQASPATWTFTAISTILFGMRTFARVRVHKTFTGWDDIIITFSWLLSIIRAALFQKAISSTKLIDPSNIPQTVPESAFYVILVDTWAFLSIAVPKLAIGILICQLFRPQTWLKVSIITLCIILNILAVIGFVLTLIQCDPVAGQWDPFRYPQAKCWPRGVSIIYACSVSALSAFTDIAFTIYPTIIIWGLKMPRWKKVGANALMGLGLASFAFAMIKLISNTSLLGNPDISTLLYHGIIIGIWNSIENDFVLAAACLPAVPPCFRVCKQGFKTHSSSFTRLSYPLLSGSYKPFSQSGKQDDNFEVELVTHRRTPGARLTKDGPVDERSNQDA